MTLRPILPICMLFCALHAYSQIAFTKTTESSLRDHLLQHDDALYPPIAKAAHIEGDVVMMISIDKSGKVTAVQATNGPAMLRGAAMDAVRKWMFKPFDQNVQGPITLSFHLQHPVGGPTPEQERAAQATFPLAEKCRESLRTHDGTAEVTACQTALNMALKAGDLTNSDQLGLLNAHQYFGHALLDASRYDEALTQENLAIDEAKKCLTDVDQEYAMPYFWRAMVEARLGQADNTFRDLTIAEETHRKAMKHLPEAKAMYSGYLKSILKQHAAFLRQLGRSEEASKLEAEAASL
jgi:TonB family protein